MENNNLQSYYDSFIREENQRSFLIGLADYVDFILTDHIYREAILEVQKTKGDLLAEKISLEKKVGEEARIGKSEFLKAGFAGDIKNITDVDKMGYSKSYSKLQELEKVLKDLQETSVWGAWERICLPYLIIFKKENLLEQNSEDSWIMRNYPRVANEIKYPNLMDELYHPYVRRVHNYLLRKMDEKNLIANAVEKGANDSIENNDGLQEVESVTIVTESQGTRNKKVWLVFNNDFANNVEFLTEGKRGGSSYIRTLVEIAYKGDNMVDFDSQVATSINSKIFARKALKRKYKQCTLIEKDGDKFRKGKGLIIVTKYKAMLTEEQSKFFPKG